MANILLDILLTNGKTIAQAVGKLLLQTYDISIELQKELVKRCDKAISFVGTEENMFEVLHNRLQELECYREVCVDCLTNEFKLHIEQFSFNTESVLCPLHLTHNNVNCNASVCEASSVINVKSSVVSECKTEILHTTFQTLPVVQKYTPISSEMCKCSKEIEIKENQNSLLIDKEHSCGSDLETGSNICITEPKVLQLLLATNNYSKILKISKRFNTTAITTDYVNLFMNNLNSVDYCKTDIQNMEQKNEHALTEIYQNQQLTKIQPVIKDVTNNKIDIDCLSQILSYKNTDSSLIIHKLIKYYSQDKLFHMYEQPCAYKNTLPETFNIIGTKQKKIETELLSKNLNTQDSVIVASTEQRENYPDGYYNHPWALPDAAMIQRIIVKSSLKLEKNKNSLSQTQSKSKEQEKHKIMGGNKSISQEKRAHKEVKQVKKTINKAKSNIKQHRISREMKNISKQWLRLFEEEFMRDDMIRKTPKDANKYYAEIKPIPTNPYQYYFKVDHPKRTKRNKSKINKQNSKRLRDPWFKDTIHMSTLLRVNETAFKKLEKQVTRALLLRNSRTEKPLLRFSKSAKHPQSNNLLSSHVDVAMPASFSHFAKQQHSTNMATDISGFSQPCTAVYTKPVGSQTESNVFSNDLNKKLYKLKLQEDDIQQRINILEINQRVFNDCEKQLQTVKVMDKMEKGQNVLQKGESCKSDEKTEGNPNYDNQLAEDMFKLPMQNVSHHSETNIRKTQIKDDKIKVQTDVPVLKPKSKATQTVKLKKAIKTETNEQTGLNKSSNSNSCENNKQKESVHSNKHNQDKNKKLKEANNQEHTMGKKLKKSSNNSR